MSDENSSVGSNEESVISSMNSVGKVDLSFPENPLPDLDGRYPKSYFTLSDKERLLLLFVENFRLQFCAKYPNRRPLVLVVKNECNVQKFVCTTIRPTTFPFHKMIGNLEECCSFVADFIKYLPLENSIALPRQLVSPDTLLQNRQGNCFEIATLLCSILIGEGFSVMIVSGTAKPEVTLNDQQNINCTDFLKRLRISNKKNDDKLEQKELEDNVYMKQKQFDFRELLSKTPNRNEFLASYESDDDNKIIQSSEPNMYLLKQVPDLKSKFEELQEEEENSKIDFTEADSENMPFKSNTEEYVDFFSKNRRHSWIVICETKSNDKEIYFIEPSTGFRHEITSENYLEIDSVWNNENYYINAQNCKISEMQWDFNNSENWQRFLLTQQSDQKINADMQEILTQELDLKKSLDMIPSWVRKLQISIKDYYERYLNSSKIVKYKQAIHENFTPYEEKTGLLSRLTFFTDDNYENPSIRWEWYENRADCLNVLKHDLKIQKVEEYFMKGRSDKLKMFSYFKVSDGLKILSFYEKTRGDGLEECQLLSNKISLHFNGRNDLCYLQEYCLNSNTGVLEEIVDKFHRREEIESNKDISVRRFYLLQNKIIIHYHYAKGASIALKREFTKPVKPTYSKDFTYTNDLCKSYKTSTKNEETSDYENYCLLVKLIENEEILKIQYRNYVKETNEILQKRQYEMDNVELTISIFDPLRNHGARDLRIKKLEKEAEEKLKIITTDPDFLAPYLVQYDESQLTYEQSVLVYKKCLEDIKQRYLKLLNKLQRKYNHMVTQSKAIEQFALKFYGQLNDLDYEQLEQQKKSVELNRNVLEERLTRTHEEACRKYDHVKESLSRDPRLNLISNTALKKYANNM